MFLEHNAPGQGLDDFSGAGVSISDTLFAHLKGFQGGKRAGVVDGGKEKKVALANDVARIPLPAVPDDFRGLVEFVHRCLASDPVELPVGVGLYCKVCNLTEQFNAFAFVD